MRIKLKLGGRVKLPDGGKVKKYNYGTSDTPTTWETKYGALLPETMVNAYTPQQKQAYPQEDYLLKKDIMGRQGYDYTKMSKDRMAVQPYSQHKMATGRADYVPIAPTLMALALPEARLLKGSGKLVKLANWGIDQAVGGTGLGTKSIDKILTKLEPTDININKYISINNKPLEKKIRQSTEKYLGVISDPRNMERAINLESKYVTTHPIVLQEQIDRMNKELYYPDIRLGHNIPSYVKIDPSNSNYKGIVDYLPKTIDDLYDANFSGKIKQRGYRISNTENFKDVYGTVSHEEKHAMDMAANTIRVPVPKNPLDINITELETPRDINPNYYRAYETMFHKLDDIPEGEFKQSMLKILSVDKDREKTRTLYDYYTTPTEVESHAMTNMRQKMVDKGVLKDHFDELTPDKLDYFLKYENYVNKSVSENPYKHLIKDKQAFVNRFNEALATSAGIGTGLGMLKSNQNKELRQGARIKLKLKK